MYPGRRGSIGKIRGSATTGLLCNTFGFLNRGPSCSNFVAMQKARLGSNKGVRFIIIIIDAYPLCIQLYDYCLWVDGWARALCFAGPKG